MKKSEVITLICGITCLLGVFAFFGVSSKIARSKHEAKRAQEALIAKEQREDSEREERVRLLNDYDWVRSQDSLPIYKRFAARFPNHDKIEEVQKRIIDLEVARIGAGEHGEMPRAQSLSYGGSTVEVKIENNTRYALTVRYSGPDSKMIVVPISASETITLAPGDYQIAASVPAGNVTNYYGRDSMRGGKYSSSFYIQTMPR